MKERTTGSFITTYGRYIIILLGFMLVVYALLYFTYRDVRQELIDDLNARQMLHARQAARGIETFFADHIELLKNLAKNEHIAVLDESGKRAMREFQSSHSGEISIITRIDTQCRILHSEPYDPRVILQPLLEMKPFQEVKGTHKVAVSDVFTNRRGFKSVIVHVPVFKKGRFNGTLAMLVPFDAIARRYIEDIRIGKDGYAWVISRNGVEISCPVPGHVGNSVFDNCREFPDILLMAERMIRGEQGITTYTFDRVREGAIVKTVKQAVFMPIRLENTFWSIVVATPEDEVTGTLHGFRDKLLLIALLFISGVGFLFYILFKRQILADEVERRQKTEEELRSKTEELDKYFTSSLDLLCIADVDGYFRRLNPEWEKTLGYTLSELEGKKFLDFIHPDDMESTIKSLDDLAEGKEVLNFVNRYHHKDGSYRHIEWRAYPADTMIYAVARDITKRKCAEEELQESRRRLADIIEFLPDATLVIDRDGKVIAWNRAIDVMTGVKAEEMLGKGNYEYALPFYGERRPILIDLALHPDPEREKEYTTIHRTGDIIFGEAYTPKLPPGEIHLSATASLLRDSRGEVIAAIECIRNNTERKKLETQLQQAQKMEAVGTLAGGIAHDFNNLLMAIQGNTSMMLMRTDSMDPRYDKMRAIEEQVLAGASLTKQLLGFARTGRFEVKPIDLNEVIEKSATMFGRTKKEIAIHKKYEQALRAVEADASQMEHVLMNLFVNSWQAMPGGGHIYLETANLTVTEIDEKSSYLKPGKYVKISVTDTGVGMDEKTKERIFEPFFTTKEMGRGTGLGLAMVYGIIKGHNGYINVYSGKEKGTTFNIYLPASEKGVLKEEMPVEIILKGQEAILLVDDEDAVVTVTKEILESLGYDVLIAFSGEEALKIYEENKDRIDLVILDMIMPEMGGGETFDRLKEINRDIKVILSSGYSLNGEATAIISRGCQDFIQKPATIAELSKKIRHVLGNVKH